MSYSAVVKAHLKRAGGTDQELRIGLATVSGSWRQSEATAQIIVKTFLLFVTVIGLAQEPLHAQLSVIDSQQASRAVWAGGNVTFVVDVSGIGPFSYQWQFNGTNLPTGVITTVGGVGPAGSLNGGYSGDGGMAGEARLNSPQGLIADGLGNVFIADTGNYRVRKADITGIISTIAGGGTNDASGGGLAVDARLPAPAGVAVDSDGNVFIADVLNECVHRVSTNGVMTTVAGKGSYGYSGDNGPATNANLDGPHSVVMDIDSNLFIADTYNNRIRKVCTNGLITTVAGNGTGNYSGDGGAATNAGLLGPSAVALDGVGNLFIADTGNMRIRKVSTVGTITTVAGTGIFGGYSGDGGPATNATLYWPQSVILDELGNLLFADSRNNRIRKVSTNGIITTVAGNGSAGFSGDGGPAINASLSYPQGVSADPYDNVFIADTYNNRIRKVTNTQGKGLALNNVAPGDTGTYRVVVTGPSGSVTSSPFNLIVATSPFISATIVNPDSSVTLYCLSEPGSTNLGLCATDISSPALWKALSTNVAGAAGNWQFTDTNAVSTSARFYRLLKQ